jgi:hypothetical protein
MRNGQTIAIVAEVFPINSANLMALATHVGGVVKQPPHQHSCGHASQCDTCGVWDSIELAWDNCPDADCLGTLIPNAPIVV